MISQPCGKSRRSRWSATSSIISRSAIRPTMSRQPTRALWRRRAPQEVAYDALLERDGRGIIYMPLSYKNYSFDSILPQLTDPATVLSLSDGGAHCGVICDASMPTYLLTHWVRDRNRGGRIPLELAIKRQTSDTAALYG